MPQPYNPNDLSRLLAQGALGLYRSLEVASVTLTQASTGQTFNVLTVIVAHDRVGLHKRAPKFLGDRIRLTGLRDLSFGIAQHEIGLRDVISELELATKAKRWGSEANGLRFGDLMFRGHWFAPADGAGDEIALNRVLKNNFWNGSHVWEWTDNDRAPFRPLLEEPRHLQALSAAVSARLPIRIAGLSDKLGGLLLQLPVQVLAADFRGRGNQGGATVELHWLPGVPRRPASISLAREYDGLFSEAVISSSNTFAVELELPDAPGLQFATIKDSETGDILGRHSLNFVRSIGINMNVVNSGKRLFKVPGSDEGARQQVETTSTHESHVGDAQSLSSFTTVSNRIYRAEMAQLRDRLELLQYYPDQQKTKTVRHEQALGDLRRLITAHGRHAVWLWDPFLDAADVLKTLFFNPHSASRMRALSGANTIAVEDQLDTNRTRISRRTSPKPSRLSAILGAAWRLFPFSQLIMPREMPATERDFVKLQRNILKQNVADVGGLDLEFRARADSAGWPFHDRFIIFPRPDAETLAWSLGTSVNSLGKQHHIMQKVPDGRLIADAFDELWKRLDQPQHLVWRVP